MSFPDSFEAVVVGASGGIGRELVSQLAACPAVGKVHAFSRGADTEMHNKVQTGHLDLSDEASIEVAAQSVSKPHLVIVATGLLHRGDRGPEKTFRGMNAEWMLDVMQVNAVGPALVAKHFLARMPRGEKTVFAAISARVGSISDNGLGGWYGYRASKAALNMLLKTLSIEHARTHNAACVLGLHPGTVATDLSAPFQKTVPEDRLFTAEFSAQRLLTVIDTANAADTGSLIAWDGEKVPF